MGFLEQWIENDFNPFIIFDSSGKIISLNKEAQFLLGEIPKETIFELANLNASSTYGFKTTLNKFKLSSYSFFGFTVGYDCDDIIGIKLYRHPRVAFDKPSSSQDKINIYTVLDLCMSATATNSKAKFIKEFDPTLPELWINLKNFVKLVTKIYESHKNSKTILTNLKIKTGEYVRYGNSKYPIFSLIINSDLRDKKSEEAILKFGKSSGALVEFQDTTTIIELPLKTS